MSEEDITKFRQMALMFIEYNKQNLLSIYMKHSKGTEENEGNGILVINIKDITIGTNNIDVSFLPFTYMDVDLLNKINKCKENNNENIIYFMLITPFEDKIIEIDIRTLIK